MSNDLNLCQFIGRLGKDPELRYMPSGDPVANFSIAVGSQWKDKSSGEKKESTEWVRIAAFGKLAEIIGEYCTKGKQVYVAGRMQTRKWEDKDGVTKYSTEVIADRLQLLGSKSDGERAQQREAQKPADDFESDSIPF